MYLGRFDANVFVELRVGERELHSLFDFLDLGLEAPHISVRLQRRFLDLHTHQATQEKQLCDLNPNQTDQDQLIKPWNFNTLSDQ